MRSKVIAKNVLDDETSEEKSKRRGSRKNEAHTKKRSKANQTQLLMSARHSNKILERLKHFLKRSKVNKKNIF